MENILIDTNLGNHHPPFQLRHHYLVRIGHRVIDFKGSRKAYSPSQPRRTRSRPLSPLPYVLSLLLVVVAGIVLHGWSRKSRNLTDERVEKILQTPLIDGHNDFAIYLRYSYNNHLYQRNFTEPFENGTLGQHVDLYRLKRGKVGGAFWCAFAFCPFVGENYTSKYFFNSYQTTHREIDTLHRIIAAYPDHFSLPQDSSSVQHIVESGKAASPLCIESLHMIGDSIAMLRNLYELGVRYATLTHNCHNSYADAAMVDVASGVSAAAEPYWGGVSPLGRALIKEMNRMGMMGDLSHTSFDTMRDTLGGSPEKGWDGSLAPSIFSHISAYALCPHPRNVPDDVLHLVKETNSLVMVTFAADFNSCREPPDGNRKNGLPEFYPPNSTLSQVVRHIRYIGDLIGYEHVGLGSDLFPGKSDRTSQRTGVTCASKVRWLS